MERNVFLLHGLVAIAKEAFMPRTKSYSLEQAKSYSRRKRTRGGRPSVVELIKQLAEEDPGFNAHCLAMLSGSVIKDPDRQAEVRQYYLDEAERLRAEAAPNAEASNESI